MKQTTCLFAILLASTAAQALEPQSWPTGSGAIMLQGEYILSGDTEATLDKLTINDGTIITTSGHDLDLRVRQELKIDGNVLIRAFATTQVPQAPSQAPKGPDGRSYERGPDTEGAATATKGADGGEGGQGQPGSAGTVGYDAGFITIRLDAGAKVSGKLIIHNDGGQGGSGGAGGVGGKGGDGQQGGRGQPNYIMGGVVAGCKQGGGRGGKAGDGGPGGIGGRGGDGGRGGTIVLQSGSKEVADWVDGAELTVNGGPVGKSGPGGAGGQPGQPGYGGRGATGCQGEETNRMGDPGKPGEDNRKSQTGENPGPPGKIKRF